jgi:PIN domain nuclease of toxin-antitoxin system
MNIFDTSAILAIIYDEPGRPVAEARLSDGAVSSVNAAETIGAYVASRRGDVADARRVFEGLGLLVLAPDLDQAARAADLKRPGLSLGDRFCLALGEAMGERIVTADQKWAAIPGLKTPLEMIR